MRVWQLPASLQSALEHYLEPSEAKDFALETSIIHIAGVITDAAASKVTPESPTMSLDPVVWQITGLSHDNLQPIKHEADRQVGEALSLIFPQMRKAS